MSFPFSRFLLISFLLHSLLFLPTVIERLLGFDGPLPGGEGIQIVGISSGVGNHPSIEKGEKGPVIVDATSTLIESGSGAGLGSGVGPGSGKQGSDPVLTLIREKIERSKQYPPESKRQGQEGIVSVKFEIDPSGNVRSNTLLKSSSYSLLDAEALATIQRAAPYPVYEKPIQLAIRFSLAP